MEIERTGTRSEPYTQMFPHIIGGVCEYCGILDNTKPSTEQYKLCPHFKTFGEMRCSYCPENVDPTEVVAHADIKVHGHPDNPNKLVVVCDTYNCSRAHEARFKRSV